MLTLGFYFPGADVSPFSFFSQIRSLRIERKGMGQQPVRRWLVLQQGSNPSTDYYIRPRLGATGLPIVYKHLDHDVPRGEELDAGTGVVIVRYLNTAWVNALYRYRHRLSSIVYFMDDDLLRPERWKQLPRTYRKKLNTHCRPFIGDIRRLSSELWFSSATLKERYPVANCRIVMPRALAVDTEQARPIRFLTPERNAPVTIFYHGTAAHQEEIGWLRPIVARVLEHCPAAHFEIVGNHDINALYRDFPRTRIVHPMSWPNYLSHCRAMQGHIGLAPLLASPFNAGRSHVKAFDIARCAAVGVYSKQGPYGDIIVHQKNGLLLDNDPDAWVGALCDLVEQRERLTALRRQAAHGFQALTHRFEQEKGLKPEAPPLS